MPIVGTAGHAEHGKSALVAALTGTNPDHWLEERGRGTTLDLEFAHLAFDDDLDAGIVDVPGDERFLHNMLAGAAGMDVLLLVVAANEGVMPQTREHLDILAYFNPRATIVAVTKIDVIPMEMRQGVRAWIASELRGTAAEDAPTVAVSSISGEGLDELRARLQDALRRLPPRDREAPVYLPIDRVFTVPGSGTVVTGTLMQGTIAAGDSLALEPSGRSAFARSIEVFGSSRARVGPGTRVELHLAGIDRDDVARGDVAVSPGFPAAASFAVSFTPLENAVTLLRPRTPVRAYLGSAEIGGLLAFDAVPVRGHAVRALLHLRQATLAFPGARFVVRRPSLKTLLGGGSIEGSESADADDALGSAESAVLAKLRDAGLEAVEIGAIACAANLREGAARDALDALAARDDALQLQRPPAYVDGAAARELLGRVLRHLEESQRAEPWAMGVTSIALSRLTAVAEPLLVRILAEFVEHGRLAGRAGYYATLDHRPALDAEQSGLFDELVPVDDAQPWLPVRFGDVVAALRRSQLHGTGKAFDTLLVLGALVKVGDGLYRGTQIDAIRARVEAYLRRNERMTASEFRDLLGTSRKYAVPLLEWLDARGVTLRGGDHRTLRR